MGSNRSMPQLDGLEFSDREKRKLRKFMFRSAQNEFSHRNVLDDSINSDGEAEESGYSSPKKVSVVASQQSPRSPKKPEESFKYLAVVPAGFNLAIYRKFKFKSKRTKLDRRVAVVLAIDAVQTFVELDDVIRSVRQQRAAAALEKAEAAKQRAAEMAAAAAERALAAAALVRESSSLKSKNGHIYVASNLSSKVDFDVCNRMAPTSAKLVTIAAPSSSYTSNIFPSVNDSDEPSELAARDSIISSEDMNMRPSDQSGGRDSFLSKSFIDEVSVFVEKTDEERQFEMEDEDMVDPDELPRMSEDAVFSAERVSGDCYFGEAEYCSLSVAENLDLYFRQQAFCPGHEPFLRWAASEGADCLPYETTAAKTRTPQPAERYVVSFSERVIDLSSATRKVRAVSASYESLSLTGMAEGLTDKALNQKLARRKSRGSIKAENLTAALAAMALEDLAEEVDPSHCPEEREVLIVLTNLNMYLIDRKSLSDPEVLFMHAPRPLLLGMHPLHSLWCCTIFFGFQRVVLSFSEQDPVEIAVDIANANHCNEVFDSRSSDGVEEVVVNPLKDVCLSREYMIVTRDKVRTYPIITRITAEVNALRQQLKAWLCSTHPSIATDAEQLFGNVRILNQDGQLLEALQYNSSFVVEKLHLGPQERFSCDVAHYQMVFQLTDSSSSHSQSSSNNGNRHSSRSYSSVRTSWGGDKAKKNGLGGLKEVKEMVLLPRTIIITETTFLLCVEDLTRNDVQLRIIDCARLKDLCKVTVTGAAGRKMLPERLPEHGFTLQFRSQSVFSSKRKWKFYTDSALVSSRLAEVCKSRIASGMDPNSGH
eukprot:CAMPEP_0170076870 /NCGR_PEP_ID=MMETSP0019_2-20121128/13803_1 /TAXON_ID=98059 /ORGANISM="Dinobryon sp., Strain UTEXLB2267" /LENGTH=821 /DNA_ID=CAMNT_0010288863 /DNA_START=1 /DNA_END=2466 /DNA_ORIENTATION=-